MKSIYFKHVYILHFQPSLHNLTYGKVDFIVSLISLVVVLLHFRTRATVGISVAMLKVLYSI